MAEPTITVDLGDKVRAWSGTSQAMSMAHTHADLEINFVTHGVMRYLILGREVQLPRRRLCLLWGATPHRTVNVQDPRLIWVTVPLAALWRMPLGRGFFARLMQRGLLIDAAPLRRDEETLRQWCADLKADDDRRARVVRLELEARLQRLVMALSSQRSEPGQRGRPTSTLGAASEHVRVMARHIAGHLREPMSVEQIAAAAGISGNHAMTLFRRHTGMTLSEHITRQRVAQAQRLLATTRRPVLQVGFDCGFGSVSRFYEAFKEQVGTSPAAFRRRHGRGGIPR